MRNWLASFSNKSPDDRKVKVGVVSNSKIITACRTAVSGARKLLASLSNKSPDDHKVEVGEVFDSEKEAITKRRAASSGTPTLPSSKTQNLVGLALSGGGIRSATFCFGVLQVLERKGLMKPVDYLSTVSGGGYTGSAYSAWRLRNSLAKQPAKPACPEVTKAPDDSLDDNFATHLLKFSNYLAPRMGIAAAEFWRILGTMLRNITLHWVVLISALVTIFAVLLLILRSFTMSVSATPYSLLPIGLLLLSGLALIIKHGWREELAVKLGSAPSNRKHILLASPHLPVFFGLGLWSLGASLAIVGSTYLKYGSWVCIEYGLWISIGLLVLAVVIVGRLGWASEWRWTPRRNYWPTLAWLSFLFVLGLPVLAWTLLHGYNTNTEHLRTSPLITAWDWVWQTGLILVVLGLMIGIIIAAFNDQMDREEREWATRLISTTLITTVAWMGLTGLVLLSIKLATLVSTNSWQGWTGAIATGGVWATLSAWAAYLGKTEAAQSLVRSYWKGILVVLGPQIFLIGLIVLTGFAASLLLINTYSDNADVLWEGWQVASLAGGALVLFFTAGLTLDPNEFSLHGFYRDRLVRCYLGASNADSPAPDSTWNIKSDDLPLSCLKHSITTAGAPFQIINTALNLFGSKDLTVRQRNCDSFVLTPLHCGSGVTGYTATPSLLYLGTALAISGAALGSAMGLATKGAGIASVLTFFNLRLGYWFENPHVEHQKPRKRPLFSPYYLFSEALSLTNENRDFVNLSDGGHFDNLGMYELLRRRCRFIMVVDAECDEKYSFGALTQLIRLARIDFNIEIAVDFPAITPNTEHPRYAQAHWAWGKIDYSHCNDKVSKAVDNTEGLILYVKCSLRRADQNNPIPGDVLGYATGSSAFPHESTADQFFSQAQFESYRKLGEYVATRLVEENMAFDANDLRPTTLATFLDKLPAQKSDTPLQTPISRKP